MGLSVSRGTRGHLSKENDKEKVFFNLSIHHHDTYTIIWMAHNNFIEIHLLLYQISYLIVFK